MSTMQATFDDAYAAVTEIVTFDPGWSEPTGSMHRAAWTKFTGPCKFVDEHERRCMVLPLPATLDGRHHALVVYERKFFQSGSFGSNGLHTAAFPGNMTPESMTIFLDLVRDGVLGPEGIRAMDMIAAAQAGNEAYFQRQMRDQFTRLGWIRSAT